MVGFRNQVCIGTVLRSKYLAKCYTTTPALPAAASRRYAIIGGGFAGVAVAYHLSLQATPASPVVLDLFDLAGLGAGASGAAGGLLHPFSPKGKLLWNGQMAFKAALELIEAAEHASQQDAAHQGTEPQQFVWRQDLLRPALDARQAAGFSKLQPDCHGMTAEVEAISAEQALQLLPGLCLDASVQSEEAEILMVSADPAAALLIKGGLVLQPQLYLRNLWRSCQQRLTALNNGSGACLLQEHVHSLTALEKHHGPYAAVVVAAGAAIGVLPEIGDKLPTRLCHGYGIEFVPGSTKMSHTGDITKEHSILSNATDSIDMPTFPPEAPSLVGAMYIGAQGANQISVGATKQYGYTAEQALRECGRAVTETAEVADAESLLRPAAQGLWTPSSDWQVSRVVTGVRALPQKTAEGAIPLAGQLDAKATEENLSSWWIVAGLGARGLVYHAWLGALLSQAICDSSDQCLPKPLLRWKTAEDHK